MLLQVYFHAIYAEQRGAFTIDDVARGITERMYRRNPHVFGPEAGTRTWTAAEVDSEWQRIKSLEKKREPPRMTDVRR